jgi:hypothetical protein
MKVILAIIIFLMIPIVYAIDTTPPLLVMWLNNDNTTNHHDTSNDLTIYARLWNRDDESVVTSCQIDWGEGNGFESITKGTEGQFSTVSHTYSNYGSKTIRYRCTSEGGTNTGNTQHTDLDTIDILNPGDSTPPLTVFYLAQIPDLSVHNDISNSLTIFAKLWNRDDQSAVISCEINWDDGNGFESVSKGAEGQFYIVEHSYDTNGIKRVEYRCTSSGGTSGTGIKHESYDSIEIKLITSTTSRKSHQESFHISSLTSHQSCSTPGGTATFSGAFKDEFKTDIKDFHFMVSIPELGIKSPRKTFNFRSGSAGSILLELPDNISKKEYYVRFDMSNDNFRRVKYRPLTVRDTC